ncbi:MAG: superinfection immunity protein [Candidatus Omnitrophica bacterium]|nr:superinfection immunity protein [Candidatus Omnitrophota bacterium]
MDNALFGLWCLIFYFIPTIVAKLRRHINFASILLLNLLLGWTILGWVGALIWAASHQAKKE